MPTNSFRIRTRITPAQNVPVPGPKLGHHQFWNVSKGTWNNPIFPSNYNTGDYHPYAEARFCLDEVHTGPPFRTGGPFQVVRIVSCTPFGGVQGKGTYTTQDSLRRYVGGFQAPDPAHFGTDLDITPISDFLVPDSPHLPSMAGWGDKAWASTKPKLEKAGGAVFLRELREVPRMLSTSAKFFHNQWRTYSRNYRLRLMQPRKAADHFLNHQFGWKPFINDLLKFDQAIQEAHTIVSRITRNNGRWVKRRVTLRDETTSAELINSGTGCLLHPLGEFNVPSKWFSAADPATWSVTEEVHSRIWAEGKWRYYRPEFDLGRPDYSSAWNGMIRHATIHGVRINPSNVYKMTPWTWAIDWVSKVGDHIDHANDILIDSVACKYLYVMQHEIRVRKFVQTLPFKNNRVTLHFYRIVESKQRVEASSPYGFGLTWSNLTPRQLLIAGALGMSRNRRIAQTS